MRGTSFVAVALAGIATASGTSVLAQTTPDGPQQAPCNLVTVGEGKVRTVLDARTFVMTDGREVRIDGIEIPPQDSTADDGGAAGLAARDALAAIVDSDVIVLKAKTPAVNRYGHEIARPFAIRDGREVGVAEGLVAQGHATVAPGRDEASCRAGLMSAEDYARRHNLGLWAEPYYGVRDADVPETVTPGRFNIVRGRVASVRESGGTIYVNFGRRWSEDFTVTIQKRNERSFVAAGKAPKTLEGRTIEVRGYAEERGGPWIEAGGPEQIVVVADR